MDVFQFFLQQKKQEKSDFVEGRLFFPAISFSNVGKVQANDLCFLISCCVFGFDAGYSAQDLSFFDKKNSHKPCFLLAIQRRMVFILYSAWQSLMIDNGHCFFMNYLVGHKSKTCFSLLGKNQSFYFREIISNCLPGVSFVVRQFVSTRGPVNKAAVLGQSSLLGFNTLLGGICFDRTKRVEVVFFVENQEMIEKYLPNTLFGKKLWHILSDHLRPVYELKITWRLCAEKASCTLGRSFLGWTTFFPGKSSHFDVVLQDVNFLNF